MENLSLFMLGEQGQKMRRRCTYGFREMEELWEGEQLCQSAPKGQHEAGRAGAQGESCG